MNVIINGQTKGIEHAACLADIVGKFCPNPKSIITEVNGAIVPRGDWHMTSLKHGDTIELVAFVGGG